MLTFKCCDCGFRHDISDRGLPNKRRITEQSHIWLTAVNQHHYSDNDSSGDDTPWMGSRSKMSETPYKTHCDYVKVKTATHQQIIEVEVWWKVHWWVHVSHRCLYPNDDSLRFHAAQVIQNK